MQRMEDIKRNIARGQILRITRIALNYEQSEMVDLMGTTKSYISLIENAKRNANDSILNKYLECFGINRQTYEKVESEVAEILFREEVEMIRVAFLVVEMLRSSTKRTA